MSDKNVTVFESDSSDFDKLLTELGVSEDKLSESGVQLPAGFKVENGEDGKVTIYRDNAEKPKEEEPPKEDDKKPTFTVVPKGGNSGLSDATVKEFTASVKELTETMKGGSQAGSDNDDSGNEGEKPPVSGDDGNAGQGVNSDNADPPMPVDGKCPDGFKLSTDGKMCVPVSAGDGDNSSSADHQGAEDFGMEDGKKVPIQLQRIRRVLHRGEEDFSFDTKNKEHGRGAAVIIHKFGKSF